MIVTGIGGTGKSQIINALTYYFQNTNRLHMLGKFAPTAKAASLIGGSTIQSCQKKRTIIKNNIEIECTSPNKNSIMKKSQFRKNSKPTTKTILQQKFGNK